MSCPTPQSNLSIRLADIESGDTWAGLYVTMTTDGSALDSDMASVTMVFKDSAGTVGLSLSNASGITMTNVSQTWSFYVNAILTFPLAAGTWSWKIRATNASGTRITRLAGTKTVKP